MHPLREHVASAARVHAVGLADEVGIVQGELVGQQLQQVARASAACLLISLTIGILDSLAEELHLAPEVVLQRPAHEVLYLAPPLVVVADV